MGDFFQNGIIATLHDFESRTTEELEAELNWVSMNHLRVYPHMIMVISKKSLYSTHSTGVLPINTLSWIITF